MFKKLFRIIKNNDGFSLVELIISFALLSIFMTAACTLLTNYMKLYTQINTMALGENVADTVMNTIEDCISDSSSVKIFNNEHHDDEGVNNAGDMIVYTTPNGNKVTIYAFDPNVSSEEDDGILRLSYDDTVQGKFNSSAEKWSLGKEAYMKYRIKSIDFEAETGIGDNIVSVELKIQNTQTGSITERKKLIECYNINPKENIKDAVKFH